VNNQRRTILVVDDEAAIRELLKLHLANSGYHVLLAEDAIVGGRMLLERRPDLLIIDAHLPYMSGIDFVATLIADQSLPAMPVVFITGREELSARAHALADECLVKPFLATDLLAVVERLLARDLAALDAAATRRGAAPRAA
jgi:two-component system phosphate regulon response regulator PhoB